MLVPVKISRDREQIRPNRLDAKPIPGRPGSHERVGGQILCEVRVTSQEERQPVDGRVMTLVDVPELVHALVRIRRTGLQVTCGTRLGQAEVLTCRP